MILAAACLAGVLPFGAMAADVTFVEEVKPQVYTGSPIEITADDLNLVYSTKENETEVKTVLEEHVDYEILFVSKVIDAGAQGQVMIKYLKQEFIDESLAVNGLKLLSFTVQPKPISDEDVTITDPTDENPSYTIKYNEMTLVEGTDFTVTTVQNDETGETAVTIAGMGNYTGKVEKTVQGEVQPEPEPQDPEPADQTIDLSKADVVVDEAVYNFGEPVEPAVEVYVGEDLVDAQFYTVEYKNNTEAGKATVTITAVEPTEAEPAEDAAPGEDVEPAEDVVPTEDGETADEAESPVYTGSKTVEFSIAPRQIEDAVFSATENLEYTGEPRVQENLTLTLNGHELIEDTDYTLVYENNLEISGTLDYAKVIATGMGNFAGTKMNTFLITDPNEDPYTIHVVSVTLDQTSAQISAGQTAQLTATVGPGDATNPSVNWSSSNPSVATVDENGLVTAVAAGTANIYAVADGVTATCTVTVPGSGGRPGGSGGSSGTPSTPAAPAQPVTPVQPGPETDVNISDEEVPLADLPLFYEDVADTAWYRDAVAYVDHNKLMNGVSETLFAPNGETNRAMVATVLYRLENTPSVEEMENIFSDVLEGMYYTEAVTWAADAAIITGYGDDTFRPTNQITREELAAILYRYAAYKGYDTSATADLTAFADADSVGEWAVEYMQWAVGTGLIQGKDGNMIDAKGTATRAQVATILMRFSETFNTKA